MCCPNTTGLLRGYSIASGKGIILAETTAGGNVVQRQGYVFLRRAVGALVRPNKGSSGRTVCHYLLRGYFIVGATFRLQFVGNGEVVGSDVRVDAGCHAFTLVRGIEAVNLFEVASV